MSDNGGFTRPTPPGIPFVFDAALKKVEEQIASVDSLDVKMGVLIAGVLTTLLASDANALAQKLSEWGRSVLVLDGIFCSASVFFAFLAFRTWVFYDGIRIPDLVTWSNEDVPAIKEAFLPTLLLTIEHNHGTLRKKAQSASLAILFAFLTLISLLATAVLVGGEPLS
jgi:hypothetical protein